MTRRLEDIADLMDDDQREAWIAAGMPTDPDLISEVLERVEQARFGDPAPKPGDRIRLISMRGDPDPIPVGSVGTVRNAFRVRRGPDGWTQVDVDWDSGRTLMLTVPPDRFQIV